MTKTTANLFYLQSAVKHIIVLLQLVSFSM